MYSLVSPRLMKGYMITTDNLLKMMCIQYRLQCNLPVLIMGETGCGKSSLITQMSTICDSTIFILNVHGGLTEEDILEWMNEVPLKQFSELSEDQVARD